MFKSSRIFLPAPLLVVIGAMLWALDGVLRRSLYVVSPLVLVTAEHGLGTLLILPQGLRALLKHKLTSQIWLIATVIALLSGLVGTSAFTAALQASAFIPFSVVFLLQKFNTIFTLISARIFLKEKLPPKFWFWSIVAILAGFLVTFPSGRVVLNTGNQTLAAALLALTAAAAWGTSTSFSKLLLARLPVLPATTLRFGLTTIFGLITITLMGQLPQLALTTDQWLRLLLIALSTGLVALLIYYKGLSRVKASQSAILELVFPLLAVVIDAVMYRTFLAPSQYLAGLVLVFVIFHVSRSPQS